MLSNQYSVHFTFCVGNTLYYQYCEDYVTNEQMNDKKFLKLVNA